MITLGCGNAGMKLATMFDDDPYLISTAKQDTINYQDYNILSVSEDGAGKRFTIGTKLWEQHYNELQEFLADIENENVIIFSSFGGGSGSSSLQFISQILLEQNNGVLINGIIPYKKEINPPLANAVQSINSLMPLITDVSVMLFDNQTLIRKFEFDWEQINEFIIRRVTYVTKLIDSFSIDKYSPITIDQSELESVVFGGGFIDVTDTFLEENNPKFVYGKLDRYTKNVMLVMYVDEKVSNEQVDEYHRTLTEVQNKIAGRVRNARLIPGIMRGKIVSKTNDDEPGDRTYILIASGLSIDRYMKKIEKIRDQAIEKAEAYNEKNKGSKIVKGRDRRLLDI